MTTTDSEVVSHLNKLKSRFDQDSDEYADISQTIHYLESYNIYNVYEEGECGPSYIGFVRAQSEGEATDKAHEKFGGPITVEKNR